MTGMSRDRSWVCACALVALIATAGARPAAAARAGSFLYFWFDPQVIYNDAKSTTTLRIYTDKKDVASVWLQTVTPTYPDSWVELYDDGTHGDDTAGDGTYALDKITSDTLGITNRLMGFGGTHSTYGFQTKIVKSSGKEETNWEVGIGFVDKSQTFPTKRFGTNLLATQYAFLIVDPQGKALDAKIPLGEVKCGDTALYAFEQLYSVMPDVFDTVIVMPAAQIFDPSRDYAENVPYEVNVRNKIQHIGLPVFNSTAKFSSKGRLSSMVYHSFDEGAILDHEVGHRWSAFFGYGLELCGESPDSHWLEDTDIGGQMGKFVLLPGGRSGQLVDNGDGTWRVERQPDDNNLYSKLDLYLMGLIPPGEVPPVHKLIKPNYSNPDRVTAKEVKTYTIEQLMDAEGGRRVPSSQSSPRKFRIALIGVKNKAFKPAEIAWFSLVAKYFCSREQGDGSLTTFYTATGGRATLNARLPVNITPRRR